MASSRVFDLRPLSYLEHCKFDVCFSSSLIVIFFRRVPDFKTYPEQRESEQTSPVLLVDATGHHKSPDLAEVPVITGIIKSPVRVVCHSPRSAGRNRLENSVVIQRSDDRTNATGHLEAGRRVKVTSVPTVNLLNSSTKKKDLSPSHFSPGKFEICIAVLIVYYVLFTAWFVNLVNWYFHTQLPRTTYFCLWATRKSYFLRKAYLVLGIPDFMVGSLWTPCNICKSTAC